MIRALVTGAQGQLGKCIQKVAGAYPDVTFEFKDSRSLDITNAESVKLAFNVGNYDYCINCAAYTDVEQAEKAPEKAFTVNAEGIKNIALACKENKVVLIHISTDYVFDGEKDSPYTVDDTPNPINVYGKSKLRGEQYIQDILSNFFIVRTSWLYSEFGKNFYTTILKKAEKQAVLYVTDQQTGCPTNANNLAKYILSWIFTKDKEYGIHHFTDGEAMTWYGFAVKILEEKGLNTTIKIVREKNNRSFVKRPKNSVLS